MAAVVLLAVDAALRCGIALPSTQRGVPHLKTIVFEPGPRPIIFREFRDALVDLIEKHGVTDLAAEGPMKVQHLRHRRRSEPEHVTRMLRGMIGICEEVAGKFCGGRYHEFDALAVKNYFTGAPYADKEAMFMRAKQLGWNPKDFDQADAGALWALTMSTLDRRFAPVMATPLFAAVR